jgi:hypothetical protein
LKKNKTSLSEQKRQLHRSTFHVHVIEEGVTVFQFESLTRQVLIPFMDHILSMKMRSPARIMFDFRSAGPPSRYMLDRLPQVLDEIKFPEDTRIGFVNDDMMTARFIRKMLDDLPKDMCEFGEFINYDPAMDWLKKSV